VQEVEMDVELCLLALPGVHKDDLKKIFSHPQVMIKTKHSYAFHVKKLPERQKLEHT